MLKLTLLSLLSAFIAITAYDNGVAPTPPMGWSSWCTNDLCGIPDRCSEYEVRRKADGMVENGMAKLGYTWLLLDDCWAHTERDANGELQPSPLLFPRGMKNLVDYVHKRGLKIGLYTCVGTETCKKGRPGSYGNFVTDANTFAKWGVDMVKADYCHKPNTNETGRDLYTQFSNALNATGHPMLFSTCQWGEDDVSEWGGDVAQMFRIQMDHIPFWSYPPKAAGVGYGQGTKQIIDFMADLHPSLHNRPHAWMDPDFLETLFLKDYHWFPMNFTNSKTEMAFWSLWASPLLVATDPAFDPLVETEKAYILMNPEVIAINQDSLFASGERLRKDVYENSNTFSEGSTQVWSRPLANGDVCIILYNAGEKNDITVAMKIEELNNGWTSADSVTVRDLWEKKDLGAVVEGTVTATLSAHESVMYRLTRHA